MAESKHTNHLCVDKKVLSRPDRPDEYHCTCEYCQNFLGEIYDTENDKFYSNRIRKGYYLDKPGDHVDVGHMIGYRWAIQNLCPENGWVLDPTVGSGTAIVESLNNDRNAIGVELEYPEVAQRNIDNQVSIQDYFFRQGNAIHLDNYLQEWGVEKGSIDLVINGTPYPTNGALSSDAPQRTPMKGMKGDAKTFNYLHPENMGLSKGKEWENLVRSMYSQAIEYLRPGGYFVILIKDMVRKKKAHLLHKEIIDLVLSDNFDLEPYGYFLHRHIPTTMFINTYPKIHPQVKIPLYQVGVVLKKL